MILPIVAYGDPVLRNKCTSISKNYKDIKSLMASLGVLIDQDVDLLRLVNH